VSEPGRDRSQAAVAAAVCAATGARRAIPVERVQTLWSGYGEIVRYHLEDAYVPTVIAKHIVFPDDRRHPRGWSGTRGHERKRHSYQVEMHWYRDWAGRCSDACRVPRCQLAQDLGDAHLIVLEDLDAAGFPLRHDHLSVEQAGICLAWLAAFHATFLGARPSGLWTTGTYWHLATRPDEWAAIADPQLREAAPKLDQRLSAARFQTLVHGDAKVANFCFSERGDRVAAVDFQYVGGGCGMKDVAYFIGSCLDEADQERFEKELLGGYFAALRSEVVATHGAGADLDALEQEWRALFPLAQADFQRFLAGWSPEHWKRNDYAERVTRSVLERL